MYICVRVCVYVCVYIYFYMESTLEARLTLYTAYCIWRIISSISNFNQQSSSLGLFGHVSLKRDQLIEIGDQY